MTDRATRTFLASAACYDRQIDWPARLAREIPVFVEVFGPPGRLGLLDAGCGSGRQATAMVKKGYRVTAIDSSADMLRFARHVATEERVRVRFVRATYAELARRVRGPLDGLYCIGNSLALAGSERGVRAALTNFARVLRPGGRLFIQVINYAQVRRQAAHGGFVRGPTVTTIDGRQYVSFKVFHMNGDQTTVTGLTLWKEGQAWKRKTFQGHLHAIEAAPVTRWLKAAGFRVLKRLGSYAGEPYSAVRSPDLILICERAR